MSYQFINLDSNIALSWPYPFTSGTVVADINSVKATLQPNEGLWGIALPPANTVSTGTSIVINNVGTNSFEIVTWGGLSLIATIIPGASVQIFLTDSATTDGKWAVINWGNINGSPIQPMAIAAITAESLDNSIIIEHGVVTPPDGKINFSLPISISNLENIIRPGIVVTLTEAPATYTTRSLVAGTNIAIDNSDGVANNPIISLRDTLRGLTAAEFTSNAGNYSVISSKGIVIEDNLGDTCAINSMGLTVNAVKTNPPTWCCFSDTGQGCTSDIVLQKR